MKSILLYMIGVVLLGCSISKKNTKVVAPPDVIVEPVKDTAPKPTTRIPVGVRGRPLDTDGDGVPDYKDKQLLTLSTCFPVDSTGFGVCPEPPCCNEFYRGRVDDFNCYLGSFTVKFLPNSYSLSAKGKHLLDSVGIEMKNNPECDMLIGSATSSNKKAATDLSWKRVNATMQYLTKQHGIALERFRFGYDVGEELDAVELIGRNDDRDIPNAPTPKRRQ